MSKRAPHKYLLAFDTSGEIIRLEFAQFSTKSKVNPQAHNCCEIFDLASLTARSIEAYRLANTMLLSEIEKLLTEFEVAFSSVVAIVVGCGPGNSLTGVRIGVATAKGLAFGLGVPLYGVPSSDSLITDFEAAFEAGTAGSGLAHEVLPLYTHLSNAEEAARAKDGLPSGSQLAAAGQLDRTGVDSPC